MPRRPSKPKKRVDHDLTVQQLFVLVNKHDFFHSFRDTDHMLDLWRKNRKFIMSLIGQEIKPEHFFGGQWVKGAIYFAYGERPDAWWRFEAKEKRQLVPGSPHWEFTTGGLYFGKPAGYCGCKGINKPPYRSPEYESQFEYLKRLDLLLPGESERYDENLCSLP